MVCRGTSCWTAGGKSPEIQQVPGGKVPTFPHMLLNIGRPAGAGNPSAEGGMGQGMVEQSDDGVGVGWIRPWNELVQQWKNLSNPKTLAGPVPPSWSNVNLSRN